MMEPLREKVLEALESVRPYLKADGGDVELVDIKEDGIVEVRLTGACVGCPMSQMTLRAGIERALMRDVPEIKRVEAVA
ncbi:MAG: NifU family protein [Melioribacteraceae bacterium]|nr:NifU family protein [Melioribacteraceae bacterium]